MSKGKIIVNRGTRTYHLIEGPEGVARTLPPGGSIEALNEKEAKHLLRYNDLRDIADAEPQTHARIEAHKREIERLQAENDALKEKHAKTSNRDLSVEELNEQSAGTGFAGPGGPVVQGTPNPETEPARQPIPEDDEPKSRKHYKGR